MVTMAESSRAPILSCKYIMIITIIRETKQILREELINHNPVHEY
jgi:hypothetical protein